MTDRVGFEQKKKAVPAPGFYGRFKSDFDLQTGERTLSNFNKDKKFCGFIEEAVFQS